MQTGQPPPCVTAVFATCQCTGLAAEKNERLLRDFVALGLSFRLGGTYGQLLQYATHDRLMRQSTYEIRELVPPKGSISSLPRPMSDDTISTISTCDEAISNSGSGSSRASGPGREAGGTGSAVEPSGEANSSSGSGSSSSSSSAPEPGGGAHGSRLTQDAIKLLSRFGTVEQLANGPEAITLPQRRPYRFSELTHVKGRQADEYCWPAQTDLAAVDAIIQVAWCNFGLGFAGP